MPTYIVSQNGTTTGKYPVPSGQITIGRARGNTIIIPNEAVSRRHAVVTPSPQGYIISDESSMNGTLLNNSRITSAILTSGDRIVIGPVTIQFEDDAPPTEPQGSATIAVPIPLSRTPDPVTVVQPVVRASQPPSVPNPKQPSESTPIPLPAVHNAPELTRRITTLLSRYPLFTTKSLFEELHTLDPAGARISYRCLISALKSLDLDTARKRMLFYTYASTVHEGP